MAEASKPGAWDRDAAVGSQGYQGRAFVPKRSITSKRVGSLKSTLQHRTALDAAEI